MDMRRVKNKWRKVSVLLAAVLSAGTLFGTTVTYGAQADGHPDLNEKGSITVTMTDKATQLAVGGGELTLYRVAQISRDDWNDTFVYTEDFADCTLAIEALSANLESVEYMQQLETFAKEHELNGKTFAIGQDGIAICLNLDLGLYLVTQSTAAKGYEPISSFLVTVPMIVNDTVEYNVNAAPKISGAVEAPTEVPTTAAVTPNGPSYYDDDDDDDGGGGGGSEILTEIPFDDVPLASFTTGTDMIPIEEDDVPLSGLIIEDGDVPLAGIPKTGQLWWPVFVLAIAGMTFLLAGIYDAKRQ